jgi:hypothetical protein
MCTVLCAEWDWITDCTPKQIYSASVGENKKDFDKTMYCFLLWQRILIRLYILHVIVLYIQVYFQLIAQYSVFTATCFSYRNVAIFRVLQHLKMYAGCYRAHAVIQLVEALRYKPEGQGFSSQWWILCFVDRASLYNLVNKTNLVHNFS